MASDKAGSAPAGPLFLSRLAEEPADLAAVQRLRYQVFVQELGGDGPLVDHAAGLERDEFDAACDHLMLIDAATGDLAAVYRLMREDQAAAFGRYYTEGEYDLAPLRRSGRRLLELGRSCAQADYRGGPAMLVMWNALADYVLDRGIEVLFGTASFHGTDPQALAQPLTLLHRDHLAPAALRPRSRAFQPMDLVAEVALDRRAALAALPPLIRAYLRLGGVVGEGAFVDHAFNTVDVCLVLDTARMSARHRAHYSRGKAE